MYKTNVPSSHIRLPQLFCLVFSLVSFWFLMRMSATTIGKVITITPLTNSVQRKNVNHYLDSTPTLTSKKASKLKRVENEPLSNVDEFESLLWVDDGTVTEEQEVSSIKRYKGSTLSTANDVVHSVVQQQQRVVRAGRVQALTETRTERQDVNPVTYGEKEHSDEPRKMEQEYNASTNSGYVLDLEINKEALKSVEQEIYQHDYISTDLFFKLICGDYQEIQQNKGTDEDCNLDVSDYNVADIMMSGHSIDEKGDGIEKKEDCGIADFNILNVYLNYGAGDQNLPKLFVSQSNNKESLSKKTDDENIKSNSAEGNGDFNQLYYAYDNQDNGDIELSETTPGKLSYSGGKPYTAQEQTSDQDTNRRDSNPHPDYNSHIVVSVDGQAEENDSTCRTFFGLFARNCNKNSKEQVGNLFQQLFFMNNNE